MSEMNRPLVSIITPCYNGERFVKRYFDCILAQTYSPLELIFINDGSTDHTEEIALSYRERLEQKGISYIYEYQENAGQAAALNRGLKLFTGEYLTWPDSDDVMTPDCIEKKVEFLLENPDVEMVRSNALFIDEITGEKKRALTKRHEKKENIFEDLLLVNEYGGCGCYMISRKLFLRCYPDRDIYISRAGQNWQLLVPAASYSLCGYLDEDLYWIYEQGQSHSRKKRTYAQMYVRWDDFTDILLHALQYSLCNQEYFVKLVRENCARQKFYYAVEDNNKQIMKTCIREMRQYGKVTIREYLLFWKKMIQ